MANHCLPIGGDAHVEFKAVAAVGQRAVEGCQCIFGNRFDGPGAAMPEQQRAATHSALSAERSVEIEVTDGLAGIRRFLCLPDRLLKLFLQQVRRVLLSLHRLLKD